MTFSIRSAITVLAALAASSVAPAQVTQNAEPLIAAGSGVMPVPAVIQTLDNEMLSSTDPLAPLTKDQDEDSTQDQDQDAAAKPTGDLASLVAQYRDDDTTSRELECLAVGVYFESKSEPLAGQLAVGEVIANRAHSGGRFPSSYCGVLFQRGQFSFVSGHSWPSIARSSRQWQNAVAIAQIVDQDLKDSGAPGALFFHAKRVSPHWRLTRVASIGNHVFYR
jgi:spore germination cell wall hydrolase CwlJ-like protein